MAMLVSAATDQRINQATSSIAGYPFTMGMWIRPSSGTNFCCWSLGAAFGGGSTASFRMSTNAGAAVFAASDGTTATTISLAGTVTAGAWHYVLARAISITNRRLSILAVGTGAITHGQSTTSRNPGTMAQQTVGMFIMNVLSNNFSGPLAEFFIADVDVQPDGAQLDNALMYQLAYGGPFSVPSLAPSIVEYRSFRGISFGSAADQAGEVYQRGTRNEWLETLGPLACAEHPALFPGYVRPGQARRTLII